MRLSSLVTFPGGATNLVLGGRVICYLLSSRTAIPEHAISGFPYGRDIVIKFSSRDATPVIWPIAGLRCRISVILKHI